VLTENVGTYGTSYRQRALIAYGGLGANLPEDAIYPTAFIDADGKPLLSTNKYVLPPEVADRVRGRWAPYFQRYGYSGDEAASASA
jgi:hypothetical protein